MTSFRDQALSGLAGVLLGFLAAYFLFESVAEEQPPRRRVHGGEAAAVATGAAPGDGEAGPAAARPPGQAPFLDRVDRIESEIRSAPGDPQPIRRLARLYFDAGLWDRAETAFERYLELAPDDPEAHADLGVSLYQQGRFDDALARFRQAQEIEPGHWQSSFNEALALFGLKRWDEAAEVVDRLREERPGVPQVEQLAAAIDRQRG